MHLSLKIFLAITIFSVLTIFHEKMPQRYLSVVMNLSLPINLAVIIHTINDQN